MTEPMPPLTFEVDFHQWFRVGAAFGLDGLDVTIDHDDPLPADHLKGLMRTEAEALLAHGHVDQALIDSVFGNTAQASPWTWMGATPASRPWTFATRERVSLDAQTHTALKDALVSGEVAWCPTSRFEVRQSRHVPDADRERQTALLTVSAAAVHHVGAWRRRGLGWVTVRPLRSSVTQSTLQVLRGGDS